METGSEKMINLDISKMGSQIDEQILKQLERRGIILSDDDSASAQDTGSNSKSVYNGMNHLVQMSKFFIVLREQQSY